MGERANDRAPIADRNSRKRGVLSRLGLDRPELRAWAMYDWAVSSVQTTIMVAVFPVYFANIAKGDLGESRTTQAIATANTVVAIILAVLSPVLGAVSDYVAAKKRMLGASMIVGAAAVAGMFFVQQETTDSRWCSSSSRSSVQRQARSSTMPCSPTLQGRTR